MIAETNSFFRLFQASVGRRMLGLGASNDEEADPDYNRQALHKLQKRNIHSHRAPTGAPGQVKQHTSALTNKNNTSNATFKIYQVRYRCTVTSE